MVKKILVRVVFLLALLAGVAATLDSCSPSDGAPRGAAYLVVK